MMEDVVLLLPVIVIAVGAFAMMLLSRTALQRHELNLIAVFFLAISIVLEIPQFGANEPHYALVGIFGANYIIDDFAVLFDLMFTIGAMMTLLINHDYFKSRNYYNGEYFALILFAVFGMMLLAHAHELITAFIALEIASISLYALVGYHRAKGISAEAMMKYLVLGSIAGVFFLLGSAILYGVTGSTHLVDISHYITRAVAEKENLTMVFIGGSFMMITILFKIGAVPFHAWVVDVYHGARYPITMLMASTFKVAVFAIALRIYLVDFAVINHLWTPILQAVTVATLVGGSWLAISQNNLKRMLAGSSIVHSGYLLIALTSIGMGAELAASALLFYLIAYFLSAAGVFGILSYLATTSNRPLHYEDFRGFATQRPYMAFMMAVFMLSLSGFPSTIGFLGKFYIFTTAVESGQLLLAGLGILTAFISIYYYFRLIAMMYFYDEKLEKIRFPVGLSTTLIALMAAMILLGGIGTGLIPYMPKADSFIDIAQQAVGSLGVGR